MIMCSIIVIIIIMIMFFSHPLPASNPGEGSRSESSSLDPGEVPGLPILSGLLHPEALWEGPLYWTLSFRGSVCGTPSRSHRNQH